MQFTESQRAAVAYAVGAEIESTREELFRQCEGDAENGPGIPSKSSVAYLHALEEALEIIGPPPEDPRV